MDSDKIKKWVIYALFVIIFVVLVFMPSSDLKDGIDDWGFYIAIPLFIMYLVLMPTKHIGKGAERKILFMVFLGVLFYLMGEIVWAIYAYVLNLDPYPSLADVFYLAGYIPFVAVIIQRLKMQKFKLDLKSSLGLLPGVVIITLTLLLFMGMSFESFLEMCVSVAYPVLDGVLISMACMSIIWTKNKVGLKTPIATAWIYLLLSFIFTAAGDIIYPYAELLENDILWYASDIMFLYGYLFVGLFAIKYWEGIKGFIMDADISVS